MLVGLPITNAEATPTNTTIYASSTNPNNCCPDCGRTGTKRDHTTRTIVDVPILGFPTALVITTPRYLCRSTSCARKIFTGGISCVEPGTKVTRRAVSWMLTQLATTKSSIASVAKSLGISWQLANTLIMSACQKLLDQDPHRFDHVRIIGVDEHKWKHTHKPGHPSDFVTVIVDLTPTVDGVGPARLLDVVPGRTKQVLAQWLQGRSNNFRNRVEVVTMDGFVGYASAVKQCLPDAVTIMDPFHVVQLCGEKLQACRRRLQQQLVGRRGRKDDVLYKNRRLLLTRRGLLSSKAYARLEQLWQAREEHVALQILWEVYQRVIAAYEEKCPARGKKLMMQVLELIHTAVPEGLEELAQLGRSLWRRRADIVAYFKVRASNGPVEAINGRLEFLRGVALGFRRSWSLCVAVFVA